MKIVQIITLTILVVGSVLTASAQILNIEQERIKTDTTGWAGSAKLSFHYSKTDQELICGGAFMHIQYKTKRSYYLNLTEYNLTKSSGSEYVNAGIQHFRYNYKFNDWFFGEAFTQAQFNKILKVKFRWLLAAGPRIKIIETKPFSLYYAALYMYEYEELYETNDICRYHRLSSYMSSVFKLGDNLNLINTNYFQPRIDKFPDYRIFSQTDLKIGINKHFSFLASYIYSYDAFPPFGIPKETHYIGNSLAYDF